MEIDTVRSMLLVATFILFRYVWVVFRYRQSRRHYYNDENCIEQLPPTYPSLIPLLGNGFSFAWNTALFTQLATSYKKTLVSTRASVFGSSIYFFQDREAVCKLIKQRNSLIPIAIRFVFPAKVLFGMPEENGLDAYRQDNSGPLSKPEVGSSIPDQDRIDHLHHQAFQHAFIGPGLTPIALRSREAVDEEFKNLRLDSSEWTEIDDLFAVIGKAVSAGLTEAMCGPSILKLHPDFIDNLWDFDRATPWLVRLIPRWINPHPHRARDIVLEQIRNWHVYARQRFHEGLIGPDGDSDPYWGSKIIRHFQNALWKSGKHSNDAMAAHDLALIWG
ncbi:hypothetical protein F4806DRAFT_470063 [Annulohypoxylon nitens]|nr:hypothetical protein F4806DRAFT_470063 [Annulohypoxylon nitens]